MIITLQKFGTTLISRQTGREAFSAFKPSLNNVSNDENIEVDFEGVITFTPSWADEFITKLSDRFGEKIVLTHTENPSVKATLRILKELG